MIPLHTLDEQGPVEASAFENGLLLPTARVMPVLDITGRHGRKPHIMMARPAHDVKRLCSACGTNETLAAQRTIYVPLQYGICH